MQKRLNEIKERKAALAIEVDSADEKRIAEITTETNALLAEEQQIRSKMDLAGRLGKTEEKPEEQTPTAPEPATDPTSGEWTEP